jgi:hypothetical protein
LGGKVEFRHSFGAEQIYFSVMIARNAGYGIAEKTVGIVLL